MKNILCFGDSNTWGYTPGTGVRIHPARRWTGVVQAKLGPEYRIIEDGMNARTTVYPDVWDLWRCGKEHLPVSLIAQKPLDLLVLSLGTNDLKFTNAFGAAKGAESLIALARMVQDKRESSPVFPNGLKALIVSPIRLHPDIDSQDGSTLQGAYGESLQFSRTFARAAQNAGAAFLDAAEYAAPSPVDCVHMDEDGHAMLGAAIANKIREILG